MAGDIPLEEHLVITGTGRMEAAARSLGESGRRVVHRFGNRVLIVEGSPSPAAVAAGADSFAAAGDVPSATLDGLTEVERIGVEAFRRRQSEEYLEEKRNRPRQGEAWDMRGCTEFGRPPAQFQASLTPTAAPTSSYLIGSVAVGVVIVEGPTAALQFTAAERANVLAEVQNGLSFYAAQDPAANLSFTYDVHDVNLTVQADPNAADKEAHWRDPAMGSLGYSQSWQGVLDYVEAIRKSFGTDWTYCAFFTKYPLDWFAYASIGGPRLVMDYNNDGWGPTNIDRVFAHETGHIFGCPDEYANSGCDCGGAWGRFGVPNGNCENCAAGGGVMCLMKGNDFVHCIYTPQHLGWSPQLVVPNFGYSAGTWRVEKHPRFLADLTGDKRADIVGFGDAGVWVSLNNGNGSFQAPQLVVGNFAYNAGGWRVEKHPRFLADLTGDGRDDIVGFGDAGVWVSLNKGNGTFGPPSMVVNNFAYDAGGWRIEKHPRFLADLTGDKRADIVGFGDAGVWVSLNNGNGTFGAPQLVVNNFGYSAGGWRVENHPRFLADLTGDGRADIVGFGDAGVWVSLNNGNGTFGAPQLVVNNFGYSAGGWRVDKHPRFLADLTGDGRADIVGFGDAGVWVSLNNGNGTFGAPQMVVANFAYSAGGWRVEKHPRFLADTSGDGRADIVGFGDGGVWVSTNNGSGAFSQPQMVVANFGYTAGGWRIEKHPRFVAEITGDGKADIVGFGDAGVWASRTV